MSIATHFDGLRGMYNQLFYMGADPDDFGIHVSFERCQRPNCILRVPYRGSSHSEDFRSLGGRIQLKVFPHDTVVRMIFSSVVTFIKDHQGDFVNAP